MAHDDDASNLYSIIASAKKSAKPVPRSPYLEPEDSPFTFLPGLRVYEAMLTEILSAAADREAQSLMEWPWQREEKANLVCVPSFEPEWALSIVGERKAGFWVLFMEAQNSLWYSTNTWYSATADPKIPSPPIVEIFRSKLVPALGGAVCDIWNRVLFQTRYPPEPLHGRDGTTYHFSYSRKRGLAMAGKTWSPEEETVPGKLVGLSQALKCYAKDAANQDVFLKAVEDHLEWFRSFELETKSDSGCHREPDGFSQGNEAAGSTGRG